MISSQKYEVVVTANLFCVGTTERQTAKTADIEAKQHPIPKQVAAYYHELQKISLKKTHWLQISNYTIRVLQIQQHCCSNALTSGNRWPKYLSIGARFHTSTVCSTYDQSTYATIQTFCWNLRRWCLLSNLLFSPFFGQCHCEDASVYLVVWTCSKWQNLNCKTLVYGSPRERTP